MLHNEIDLGSDCTSAYHSLFMSSDQSMQKKKIQDMKNWSSIYFLSPMFKKTCNTYYKNKVH